MVELRNKATAAPIGEVTDEQLAFLIDLLEEEDSEDQDYWISQATLDYFNENGCDPQLLQILQAALGGNEGIEIEWSVG